MVTNIQTLLSRLRLAELDLDAFARRVRLPDNAVADVIDVPLANGIVQFVIGATDNRGDCDIQLGPSKTVRARSVYLIAC